MPDLIEVLESLVLHSHLEQDSCCSRDCLLLTFKRRHTAQLSLSSLYTPPPPQAVCAPLFQ